MAKPDATAQVIRLLEALTAAPNRRLTRARATELLGCSADELDRYLALISTLSDRAGGTRAIVLSDGEDLFMVGESAELQPLRLSMGESLSLGFVLDALNIDAGCRERIARALLPADMPDDAGTSLATTSVFGSWRGVLAEAIQDGVRCRIAYRAQGEQEPRERLVDPLSIETGQDAAYLLAWDVDKDAPRRYRLERISSVALTEDSVDRHPEPQASIRESLRRAGERATLEMPADAAAQLTWAGIERCAPAKAPGRAIVEVRVGAHAWLFDQVLAGAGSIIIRSPQALVDGFRTYAEELLAEALSTR